MKLDRNTNPHGHGKYALINLRKLLPILNGSPNNIYKDEVTRAWNTLLERGVITMGHETQEDQFFVMKYGDKFTADGLAGYAAAVAAEILLVDDPAVKLELSEYAAEMCDQSHKARRIGNRIPD